MKKLITMIFVIIAIIGCIPFMTDNVKAISGIQYENLNGAFLPTGRLPLSYNGFIETYQKQGFYTISKGTYVSVATPYIICVYWDGTTNVPCQINFSDGSNINYMKYQHFIDYDHSAGGHNTWFKYFNTSSNYLFALKYDTWLVGGTKIRTKISNSLTSAVYFDVNKTWTGGGALEEYWTFNVSFGSSSANFNVIGTYSGTNNTNFDVPYVNTGILHHFLIVRSNTPASLLFTRYDDFVIKYTTTSTGGSYGNLDDYNLIGYTDKTSYTDLNHPYLEKLYNLEVNTIIRGVDLQVSTGQYNSDSNLSHYHLNINNNAFGTSGHPSYFFPNPSGYGYILRWVYSLNIQEQKPVFEFGHSQKIGLYAYWQIYDSYPSSTTDLDVPFPDGLIQYRYGTDPLKVNGLYDQTNYINYDLAMKFYYGSLTVITETSPYNDLITTTKLTFTEYEHIPIFWFVSKVDYTNYLRVYNKTGQVNIQGYPLTLTGFTGIADFLPLKQGWYRFELVRNSIILKTLNVTVTANTDNYILASYPQYSPDGTFFTVYYKYNRDDSKNGLITVSDFSWITPDNIEDGVYYKESITIPVNTTGSFQVFGDSTDAFINMYVKISNGTYLKVKSIIHHVGVPTDYSIDVLYDSLPLIGGTATQRFYVSQNALDKVFVILNGVKIKDVSGMYMSTFDYDITTSGVKNVTLVLETVNGTIVLASKEFVVTGEEIPPEDITSGLTYEQKLIIGFGIAIGFLSIPLIIQLKSGSEINMFIYLFFGVFGTIIATVLEFLNPIILGSIMVILILILAVMWLKGRSE